MAVFSVERKLAGCRFMSASRSSIQESRVLYYPGMLQGVSLVSAVPPIPHGWTLRASGIRHVHRPTDLKGFGHELRWGCVRVQMKVLRRHPKLDALLVVLHNNMEQVPPGDRPCCARCCWGQHGFSACGLYMLCTRRAQDDGRARHGLDR